MVCCFPTSRPLSCDCQAKRKGDSSSQGYTEYGSISRVKLHSKRAEGLLWPGMARAIPKAQGRRSWWRRSIHGWLKRSRPRSSERRKRGRSTARRGRSMVRARVEHGAARTDRGRGRGKSTGVPGRTAARRGSGLEGGPPLAGVAPCPCRGGGGHPCPHPLPGWSAPIPRPSRGAAAAVGGGGAGPYIARYLAAPSSAGERGARSRQWCGAAVNSSSRELRRDASSAIKLRLSPGSGSGRRPR
ncbi:uncharacterized protein LOC120688046 isoform X2 [Panicum virgatum]|uniref:uncharacterized protein LOC120688046 isoform X2 n=1 Tax=Panicum virgatum TaxID=38727 RepID=UPI0019D5DCE4|nr:uncharacterized protein LOC120688046 isoform X2 [Panicum virgatum]